MVLKNNLFIYKSNNVFNADLNGVDINSGLKTSSNGSSRLIKNIMQKQIHLEVA